MTKVMALYGHVHDMGRTNARSDLGLHGAAQRLHLACEPVNANA